MSLVAKGSSYEKPKAGNHNAVCINVVDVGIQKVDFKGQEKEMHKCVILFELEDRYTKGERAGKRFLIGQTFTVSLSPKANLRDFIEWWMGKKFPNEKNIEFDIENLIGKSALIEIVHNGDYANIGSISRPVKTLEPEALGYVPDWVKDMIAKRLDQDGQTLDIADEFYDDPNAALEAAHKADNPDMEGGIDFKSLSDDDIPFASKEGDEIPY